MSKLLRVKNIRGGEITFIHHWLTWQGKKKFAVEAEIRDERKNTHLSTLTYLFMACLTLNFTLKCCQC